MAEPTSSETIVAPAIDPAVKAEIDQQMAISLNGGVPPQQTEPAGGAAGAAPAAPVAPPDPFGVFKEKFGYESPEAAVQEIEALRAFKAAPPAAELKFENEQSRQVVEALQAGKFDEVYAVLDQQMKIDRLTTGDLTPETAADVVKLGMQLKYKDLTPQEIAYKFNKQYAMPPKPAPMPAEYQEEYDAKIADWQQQCEDKKMELLIDAKLARPDLLSTKQKLVFPTINRQQDEQYQEWQKTVQENDRLAAETAEAYKAFTPKSLETKLHFKDEPNKIDFEFTHEPDPEGFKQAFGLVTDINEFWKSYINPDGTPDRKRFLEDIYFAKNRNKILLDAMNQAKNATIKASLPDNATGGLVRQLPTTQEPSELDRLMRESLKGYGGF